MAYRGPRRFADVRRWLLQSFATCSRERRYRTHIRSQNAVVVKCAETIKPQSSCQLQH
jgi:hypothetical protein